MDKKTLEKIAEKAPEDSPPFDGSRILPMPTDVWVAAQNKNLTDFRYVGVQGRGRALWDRGEEGLSAYHRFISNVPQGAIVVTDLRSEIIAKPETNSYEILYGTAILPKS